MGKDGRNSRDCTRGLPGKVRHRAGSCGGTAGCPSTALGAASLGTQGPAERLLHPAPPRCARCVSAVGAAAVPRLFSGFAAAVQAGLCVQSGVGRADASSLSTFHFSSPLITNLLIGQEQKDRHRNLALALVEGLPKKLENKIKYSNLQSSCHFKPSFHYSTESALKLCL